MLRDVIFIFVGVVISFLATYLLQNGVFAKNKMKADENNVQISLQLNLYRYMLEQNSTLSNNIINFNKDGGLKGIEKQIEEITKLKNETESKIDFNNKELLYISINIVTFYEVYALYLKRITQIYPDLTLDELNVIKGKMDFYYNEPNSLPFIQFFKDDEAEKLYQLSINIANKVFEEGAKLNVISINK